MIWRLLVVIAGVAVVGAATHANVEHAGGYESDSAPLIITMAALLAIGMGYVGVAFNEGRRLLAVLLGICLLAGETYWVGLNAEREVAARDEVSAPVAEAQARHAAAKERLNRAEAAKHEADAAAISEAAKKHCANNCRKLLLAAQGAAEAELVAARAAVKLAPAPRSATPLPDRLGIAPWAWDLLMAGLRSLAVVGASIAIGMAAHPRRKPNALTASSETTLARPVNKREHVSQFLRSTLQPNPTASASLRQMHNRYLDWCAEASIDPLPPTELGLELRSIIDAIGLECRSTGKDVIVWGAGISN